MPRRPKGTERRLEAKTEIARQAFLHGNGDGNPVTSTARLASLSGCSISTLERHIPAWIKEREEMLIKSGNSIFELSVSRDALAKHQSDLEFLRKQADSLKGQIEYMPEFIGELRKVLTHLKSGLDKDEYQAASMAFQMFLKAHCNVRDTTKLLLAVQARWTQHAGIDALSEVAMTRQKALASGRAKLDLKREEGQGSRPAGGLEDGTPGSRDDVFDVGGTESVPGDTTDPWQDMGEI